MLELFNRIMNDRRVLPSTGAHKELYQLIKYVLGKFFRKVESYPLMYLEVGQKSYGFLVDVAVIYFGRCSRFCTRSKIGTLEGLRIPMRCLRRSLRGWRLIRWDFAFLLCMAIWNELTSRGSLLTGVLWWRVWLASYVFDLMLG